VRVPVISKVATAGRPSVKQIFEYDVATVAGKSYSFKF
jgi:hypothetical protein